MKLRKQVSVAVCLLLVAALLCGCQAEKIPYEINDGENYTVSVTYDANGGHFTTNTAIITDSYNLSELPVGADGKATVALLSPDAAARGNDAFTATRTGYYLAGWYAERTEAGKNAAGETQYTYGKKWDFATDRLLVDKDKSYSSAEPVLTLYAAWLPRFEVQFYTMEEEYIGNYVYEPDGEALLTPTWDTETGAMKMYHFPERNGYTFNAAYYDAAATRPVGDTVIHPGTVDLATATAKDTVLKLYTKWDEGNWYHIYTVEQLQDNASTNGNYVLHADLDFTGENWPTALMHGNFAGSFVGNGHTVKNVTLTQTNASKQYAGLFGQLTETASITDVTFENVTFTIEGGTRKAGACFGLLTGSLSADATVSGVQIKQSRLLIDSDSYFGVTDYAIGLVCGYGDFAAVSVADITCEATGEQPDKLTVTVSGNSVTLEFVD